MEEASNQKTLTFSDCMLNQSTEVEILNQKKKNDPIQTNLKLKRRGYLLELKLKALDYLKIHNVNQTALKFRCDCKRIRE